MRCGGSQHHVDVTAAAAASRRVTGRAMLPDMVLEEPLGGLVHVVAHPAPVTTADRQDLLLPLRFGICSVGGGGLLIVVAGLRRAVVLPLPLRGRRRCHGALRCRCCGRGRRGRSGVMRRILGQANNSDQVDADAVRQQAQPGRAAVNLSTMNRGTAGLSSVLLSRAE